MTDAPDSIPDWQRDLAWVLGGVPLYTQVRPRAFTQGTPVAWQDGVHLAATLLRDHPNPAYVGLHPLTMESARVMVNLARATHGRLLPRPHLESPLQLTQPVTQAATLGYLNQCTLLIGVGMQRAMLPGSWQTASQAFEALPDGLDLVIALRKIVQAGDTTHPVLRRLTQQPSVGVLLPAWCDPRVASQWHQLAAELQPLVRLSVVNLPDPESLNAKGVASVIAWQTGVGVATGGVSFATGQATPCHAWDATLCQHQPRVIVDTGRLPINYAGMGLQDSAIIRIASEMDSQAAVSFVVPDLAMGTLGRVMRFDGAILWLCEDPARAQPDLTHLLLEELLAETRPLPRATPGD